MIGNERIQRGAVTTGFKHTDLPTSTPGCDFIQLRLMEHPKLDLRKAQQEWRRRKAKASLRGQSYELSELLELGQKQSVVFPVEKEEQKRDGPLSRPHSVPLPVEQEEEVELKNNFETFPVSFETGKGQSADGADMISGITALGAPQRRGFSAGGPSASNPEKPLKAGFPNSYPPHTLAKQWRFLSYAANNYYSYYSYYIRAALPTPRQREVGPSSRHLLTLPDLGSVNFFKFNFSPAL
ncbi:hypothetical protein B0H14DRAFT_3133300 [Mycena olivaceomarginata]|nr:hypothetical protein B0H14DRAFT_3133300 [Mycena olivaceomarginata]